MSKADDILIQTFCIYCQKEYKTPKKLQDHVHMKHPGTYADYAIREANVRPLGE